MLFNWSLTWCLARLKGLGVELKSFLWKLLRKLLPTQDRVSKILKNKNSHCQLCPDQVDEDLGHALVNYSFRNNVGTHLQDSLSNYMLDISSDKVLLLGFGVKPHYEFPLVWLSGHYISSVFGMLEYKRSSHFC